MNSTILRYLAYFDRAYALCERKLLKTKDQRYAGDMDYWFNEKHNFLSMAQSTLSDEEYIKLTIY